MTANEYRALLDRLDLTQAGAAKLLGVNERTSRRWAAGKQEIPPPAERFLRLLLATEIEPWEAMELLDGRVITT